MSDSFTDKFKNKQEDGSDSDDSDSESSFSSRIKKTDLKAKIANKEDIGSKFIKKRKEDGSQLDKIIEKKKDIKDLSFADKLEKEKKRLVYLVRGKDQGRPAWHYVRVHTDQEISKMAKNDEGFAKKREKLLIKLTNRNKNNLQLFLDAVNSGTLDVADYGNVILSGWGKDPSKKDISKIKEMYDIGDDSDDTEDDSSTEDDEMTQDNSNNNKSMEDIFSNMMNKFSINKSLQSEKKIKKKPILSENLKNFLQEQAKKNTEYKQKQKKK